MQNTTNEDKSIEFFAAANGYDGFRSYFDETFNSSDFERVFVLKGGPGTGKSSLMRKLAKFGEENAYSCERILCSSDPHSLDGVILEKNRKRFAILDGTAPHTRDADIPGAVDEIVNLGENWNDGALIKNRGLILELNKKKKSNYSLAYRYLSYAGAVKQTERLQKNDDIKYKSLKSFAKSEAERLFKNESTGKVRTRLISSFGRFGHYKVETLSSVANEILTVKELGAVSAEYMNAIARELLRLGASVTLFPDALNGSDTEAIYLPESGTAIMKVDSNRCEINPSEFLINNPNIISKSAFEPLYGNLIGEAKKFFTFASDLHFELEKIYISAMDFEANEIFSEKIVEKIKNLSL